MSALVPKLATLLKDGSNCGASRAACRSHPARASLREQVYDALPTLFSMLCPCLPPPPADGAPCDAQCQKESKLRDYCASSCRVDVSPSPPPPPPLLPPSPPPSMPPPASPPSPPPPPIGANGLGGSFTLSPGDTLAMRSQAACESYCGTCTKENCCGGDRGWRCSSQRNCNGAYFWSTVSQTSLGCGWNDCVLASTDNGMVWSLERPGCQL